MTRRLGLGKAICLAALTGIACGGAPAESQSPNTASSKTLPSPAKKNAVSEPPRLRPLGETEKSKAGESDATPAEASPQCPADTALPSDIPQNVDAETLRKFGRRSLLSKNSKEALVILLAAEKKAPENPALLSDLALAFIQCRLYDAAVARAEKAARLAPDHVDIVANLAEIYRIAGRSEDAISVYRDAAERGIADAAAYNNLAVLQLSEGNVKGAETAVRKASALEPENARFLINLGYILLRQKRLTEAETVLRRAVKMNPDDPDALNQLGVVLTHKTKKDEAKKCFEKALLISPDHKAARENLNELGGAP